MPNLIRYRKLVSTYWKALWKLYVARITLPICILLSLRGVYYCAFISKNTGDGGKGGAIADALALVVMFLDRSFASELYQLDQEMTPTVESSCEPITEAMVQSLIQKEITSLLTLLAADARNQKWQNVYLAFSTGIGTLFWGFGDWWAYDLSHPKPHSLWAFLNKLLS